MQQVILNVDDEVKAAGDALMDLCKDIQAKASLGQYFADLSKDLAPALGGIGMIGADLKAKPDNRKYLAMALEQAVEVFLLPVSPAPVPAPAV